MVRVLLLEFLGVFEVFVTDAGGAEPTILEFGQTPYPIAPRDKISRKGKPLAPTALNC